jgi:hypothetical protein
VGEQEPLQLRVSTASAQVEVMRTTAGCLRVMRTTAAGCWWLLAVSATQALCGVKAVWLPAAAVLIKPVCFLSCRACSPDPVPFVGNAPRVDF